MLVRVCRHARAALRARGSTDADFVVVVLDDEHREELITRVLPPSLVRRHFPEFDEQALAWARLAALPVTERAADLATRLAGTAPSPSRRSTRLGAVGQSSKAGLRRRRSSLATESPYCNAQTACGYRSAVLPLAGTCNPVANRSRA
jgi:hypothetical protein